MSAETTKLSSSVTLSKYYELEQAQNRIAIRKFIIERFEERYFRTIENSKCTHGFTIIAVACLVIETLESFYQGKSDTKNMSKKMFADFFMRETKLKVFGEPDSWFYNDIRCGILHQGEVRNGWRIWRKGHLLDTSNKTINATLFLQELRSIVVAYGDQLTSDEICWQHFKNKMAAVCANCSAG